MFTLQHILYMVVAFAVTGVLLWLGKRYLKTDEGKNLAVRWCAWITVLIHISDLWVDFLKNAGAVEIPDNVLFLIYPCNICMWLLVLVSCMPRNNVLYRILSEFTCLGGTVCGIIGLVFNANFDSNPTLLDYSVLKGLLSHSTMILGTLFLGVSGLVKIRVRNVLSVVSGLLLFLLIGLGINAIFAKFGIEDCNAMYLQEPPFASMPWLNTAVMGVAGVAVAFIFTVLFEKLALKKKWKEIFTLSALLGDDIIKPKADEINE
ncbi:MAG: YwaF family protein [Clostridia bacterium]|nr:YwaF family protein [Clostridia bacterium]